MQRGAYHDPSAGRESLGAFWADGSRAVAGYRSGPQIAYDEIWRLYLSPLAPMPLASITPADVEDVIRARTRAADIHKVLRAILGRAVKAGKIATNPASAVQHSRPRAARSPGRCRGKNWTRSSRRCPTATARSSSSPPTPRSGGRSSWRCAPPGATSFAT